MQPNPSALVNMATKSDRNLSSSQQQSLYFEELTQAQMWPEPKTVWGTCGGPVAPNAQLNPTQRKQLDEAITKSKMSKEAVKFDEGKVDWTLVPFEALEGMAQVLTFGAKKYDSWNWTTGGGFKWTRILGSCLRHIYAFMRGEDNDPESGLSHISHAQCNLLFLAYYIRNKNQFPSDDRYVR